MGEIFEKIYVVAYGETAIKIRTTPRVVGFVLHKNPDPKNIFCHRIVF